MIKSCFTTLYFYFNYYRMKKSFFIFGVFISTLSTCFAELISGATHVLNFTDEEVEALQQLLYFRSPDRYEDRLSSMIDPNILKKYPPHNIKNSEEGFSDCEIQNKENILNAIECLTGFEIRNFNIFSGEHYYIAYLILIAMLEKVELTPFSSLCLSDENDIYYKIINSLCLIVQFFPNELANVKTFPKFRKLYTSTFKESDVNDIFLPENIILDEESKKKFLNYLFSKRYGD